MLGALDGSTHERQYNRRLGANPHREVDRRVAYHADLEALTSSRRWYKLGLPHYSGFEGARNARLIQLQAE